VSPFHSSLFVPLPFTDSAPWSSFLNIGTTTLSRVSFSTCTLLATGRHSPPTSDMKQSSCFHVFPITGCSVVNPPWAKRATYFFFSFGFWGFSFVNKLQTQSFLLNLSWLACVSFTVLVCALLSLSGARYLHQPELRATNVHYNLCSEPVGKGFPLELTPLLSTNFSYDFVL